SNGVAVDPTRGVLKLPDAGVNLPVSKSRIASWVVALPVMVVLMPFLRENLDFPVNLPAARTCVESRTAALSPPTAAAIFPSFTNFFVVESKNSALALDLFPPDHPPI